MAHGIEARVPFLDRNFLDVAMSINAESKQPMRAMGKPEKYILRAAFDTQEDPFLPAEILWRQKEQFSDGVGYSWIDGLVEFCNNAVSDAEFATAEARFPHNTPTTKEAFYFRNIFEELFPQDSAIKSVLKWIPKWQKNTDPSGRVADVHEKRIESKVA
jgi:asparagine synthase (glutamine-hydrolysing)